MDMCKVITMSSILKLECPLASVGPIMSIPTQNSFLLLAISKSKVKTGTTSVTSKVSLGQTEEGGYKLAVEMLVNIPDVSLEKAQELADFAHQICPYSNATRGNIEVVIKASNN